MEVTTGQIIVFSVVIMLIVLSGIIGDIAVSAQKGEDWEDKN